MMAANVGFSSSPPSTRVIASSAHPSSPTSAVPPASATTSQEDFKNWFFHTAAFNHPDATGATSPKALRKLLRRAWKTLESSPYYKSLRSAGGESSHSDLVLAAESGLVSRSAPGSPPSPHRRFKKGKSANKTGGKMRPATAHPSGSTSSKSRPFSAGSVASVSSSEGSEVAVGPGADDQSKKLINQKKRSVFNVIRATAKVRPKSSGSGILRQPPPAPANEADANQKNVYFSAKHQDEGANEAGKQTASEANKAAAVKRTTSAGSAGSMRKSTGGDTVSLVSDDGAEAAKVIIDAGNAGEAAAAQLTSIAEVGGDVAKTKKKGALPQRSSKMSIADVKVIDETASTKSSKSTSSSGKLRKGTGSASTAVLGTAKKLATSESKVSLASYGRLAAVAASTPTPGHPSAGSTAASPTPPAAASEEAKHEPRFSTTDSADLDGASSKGSKDTKSEKSSTKDGSTKSSLKSTKDSQKEAKTDTAAKPLADKEKDKAKDEKKDAGKGKQTEKEKKDKPDSAAVTTQPTPGTGAQAATPAEGEAAAESGQAAEGGDKAPLKREMSRISVKTNESRKSIDMSKHIMNLIQTGQNQEEQAKKPQTTNQSYIQQAIPALPMSAAIMCLMLNLVAPGIGTIISGFLIVCMGKPRIEAKENAVGLTIFVNCFVGISQLMTVTFFFVGWFWSMVWGINMVINSVEYRAEKRAERERELQQNAMRAFGFIRADAAPAVDE